MACWLRQRRRPRPKGPPSHNSSSRAFGPESRLPPPPQQPPSPSLRANSAALASISATTPHWPNSSMNKATQNTVNLADVNVLVYAFDEEAHDHSRYLDW